MSKEQKVSSGQIIVASKRRVILTLRGIEPIIGYTC